MYQDSKINLGLILEILQVRNGSTFNENPKAGTLNIHTFRLVHRYKLKISGSRSYFTL